MVNFRQVNY